jgi:hydrogenase maturation protease
MRTLVIGVGSEIRGDDGIGPLVAEALARAGGPGWEWSGFAGSALDLLPLVRTGAGHERVVLIDCLDSGQLAEGAVARVELPDDDSRSWASSHHVGLLDLLAVARRLGVPVCADVRCYLVGVRPIQEFCDTPSRFLLECVPSVVREIQVDLEGNRRSAAA